MLAPTKDKEIVEFTKKFKNILDKSKNILITGHKNPDGDAIGSALSIYTFLKNLYKDKNIKIAFKDKVPYFLSFLPFSDKIENLEKYKKFVFDIIIVCDTADIKRIGTFLPKAKYIVEIDHHKERKPFGNLSLVKSPLSSTAELVFEVLYLLNPDLIDLNISYQIYTGICSDTAGFSYETVTTRTFSIASFLLSKGVNPRIIFTNLYERNPYRKLKLLSLALSRIKLWENIKFARTFILKKDLEKYKATYEDTEGFVNYPRSLENVEIAAFYLEEDFGFKVSLRSKLYFDVSLLALKFGGGGHKHAAGFEVNIKDVKKLDNLLVENIKNLIENFSF